MKLKVIVVTLLLVLLAMQIPAQDRYSEIVSVDSTKAEDLHSRSKLFITEAFKSGKDVTQLVDDNTKTIVGRGWMEVIVTRALGVEFPGQVWFKVTISSKDDKYKYSFSDFVLHYQGGTARPKIEASLDDDEAPRTVSKKQWQAVKSEVDLHVKKMIADLKLHMSKSESW